MASNTSRKHAQDEVEAQLADLERQGGGIAKFAHTCATLLLIAGSLGSLISISAQAFEAFLASLNAGRLDLPNLINTVVGILLVLAGDAALLYAASMLRVLLASPAENASQRARLHLAVMLFVSVIEAATFLYMAWLFDPPHTFLLWAIDVSRALAWPLLCAYLSLARGVPVSPDDIAYQTALASGRGLVRDVARLSADPDAALHRKVSIYGASADMTETSRAKFDAIIKAVSEPQTVLVASSDVVDDKPPTGPGSPVAGRSSYDATNAAQAAYLSAARRLAASLSDDATNDDDDALVAGLPTHDATSILNGSAASAQASGVPDERTRIALGLLEDKQREHAYKLLEQDPDLSPNALVTAIEKAGLGKIGWRKAARFKNSFERRPRRIDFAQ